jgi:hypothetical protein
LFQAVLDAFLRRTSGLREIAERHAQRLGTNNFSTLSHALNRPSAAAFARAILEEVSDQLYREQPGDLVAIDTMMITLPKTQRHGLERCNNTTVGCGILWLFNTSARAGQSPVRLVTIRPGAWHETTAMREAELTPRGPIYLMDRGFYKLSLIHKWQESGVRFVIRARTRSLVYTTLETLGERRALACGGELVRDELVRVGGDSYRSERPVVRLLVVTKGDETFRLMTSERDMPAEQVMAAYKTRWQIELFHRLLKELLGLAHLYSFKQHGVEFQLSAVVLLALLGFMSADETGETVVKTMQRGIIAWLKRLGLGRRWQRNTLVGARGSPKKRRRKRRNL